ncbi:MAG: hypothetical protein H6773_02200 [Pseudomonadales bacterium]|nr:hypothetical protein [Pseudomonadales bacterium]
MFWTVWPPEPLVWNYNPRLSAEGSTGTITQTITVDNILPTTIKNVYVGLTAAAYGADWDGRTYTAINPPTDIIAGMYFNPPSSMFKFDVRKVAPGNITLSFEAPPEDCAPVSSPRPSPTPSPSPSPSPIGPMCLSITMQKLDGSRISTVNVGDAVQFTCGEVKDITEYQFRVITPNLEIKSLEASGNISAPYTVETFGKFFAQCRICPSGGEWLQGLLCQEWEPVPGIPLPTVLPAPGRRGTETPPPEQEVSNDLDPMMQ